MLARIEDEGVLGSAELSGRLYWRVAAEQGTAEAGRLFAIHHGSVPQATEAERHHAATIIERHVEDLSAEFEAGFATMPASREGLQSNLPEQLPGVALGLQQADTQALPPGAYAHAKDIDSTLEQAGTRLHAARQEQSASVTAQQHTGQGEVRRAEGVLGDQHDIHTSGQQDAADTAIGASIQHHPRPSTRDTIKSGR